MERRGRRWLRGGADRFETVCRQWTEEQEARRTLQHGEPRGERQVIVSGWPRWLRRRHFRAEVGRWGPEGYVLVEVVEGPEQELFRAGRCPTVMLDKPDQRVIVGTLRR